MNATREAQLERLNREAREVRQAIHVAQSATELQRLSWDLGMIEAHIENVESGVPCCRDCGQTEFRAWYPVDEGQSIEVERADDGSLTYDYTGLTKTGESGEDYEYWCCNCEAHSTSLEWLVGDLEEEPDGEDELQALRESCGYSPDEEGPVDALIAYKDALEDAYLAKVAS